MNQNYKSSDLGIRMKEYEGVTQGELMRRTPVILRLDGRAFHTFTKKLSHLDPHMVGPFSLLMNQVMVHTCINLVENIQNCVFAYTQSDEISLLLRDWDTLETQTWFGNNIQKIVSVSASIATAAFNHCMSKNEHTRPVDFCDFAQFDSRAYNIPNEEVVNFFIWRQQDASRNSVQMLGHHHFSQRDMHGKNNSEVQDMLMLQKSVNWNNIPTWMKRGTCVFRTNDGPYCDHEIPIFTQNRSYVSDHLLTPSEILDRSHVCIDSGEE